ncbi:MAG: IS91 family transposase [Terriglobales bacterium]
MSEQRLEVADVFRIHEDGFLAQWGQVLSREQRKAFADIRDCRTAALGGHVEQFDCGHRVPVYNSCTNRSCPKCQAAARAKWLAEREKELLPVDAYFHVVFTLPQEIAQLALQNAREIYRILFRAASETLLTIAADPQHFGADIGFLAVLHTWGQNLHLHPHIHCVVPGGGISNDGSNWIAPPKTSFFLPVKVLGCLFRKKFLIYLKKAFRKGKLRFQGELEPLAEPSAFAVLCDKAHQHKWVVYAKPPFGGPEQVLKYLARYVQRVAISNSRLLSLEDGQVTFEWRDYADGGQSKTMALDAVEFIRRFLLHVLPSGFVRIRHFGFLANRHRAEKLALCRSLLPARPTVPEPNTETGEPQPRLCPICKVGWLVSIEILPAAALARAPAPTTADTS